MGEHHHPIERTLSLALVLTFVFFIIEVVGGWLSGSLSLLADAGHMFRDVFSLLISLGAVNLAKRLPSKSKTFGYHRFEIFAAFLNGLLLIAISGWIFWETYQRLQTPEPVQGGLMFVVALAGLLVNAYIAFKLHGSADLNVKSAYLHVLTDTISSVAVIAASIWIYFTGQTIVDPILGFAIGAIILISSLNITWKSVAILLDFVPGHIDFDDVIRDIEKTEGVIEARNVNIRSLCSNVNTLEAHIHTDVRDMAVIESMKEEIKEGLGKKYNIKHATLEFECETCRECREECIIEGKIKRIEH